MNIDIMPAVMYTVTQLWIALMLDGELDKTKQGQ